MSPRSPRTCSVGAAAFDLDWRAVQCYPCPPEGMDSVMRGIVIKTGPQSVRSLARSKVTRWLIAIFIGASSAGGYAFFGPQLAGSFPFTCNLPAQTVIDEKAVVPEPDQGEIPMPNPASLASSEEIADKSGPGDSLLSLLSCNGVTEESALEMARELAAKIAFELGRKFTKDTVLKEDRRYNLSVDGEGRLINATIELAPDKVFHAIADKNGVRAEREDVVLDFKVESAVFKVRNSLHQSILKAGEGQALARDVVNVFRWDIDFSSESVEGDLCKVLFQRKYADDRPVGYGDVLCAVYEGQKIVDKNGKRGGSKKAVLFNGRYYDEKGVSLKKDFLCLPISVVRITSRYGMRFHPLSLKLKMHQGIDYGAPIGTPVWAVANGVVTFAGWSSGGYGNFVTIRHDNGCESRYGHLSKINVKQGARVKQGQNVGLVGMTGYATGPHLHFEFLVNGVRKDPASVKMVKTVTKIPQPLMARFDEVRQGLEQDLDNLLITTKDTGLGRAASLR